VYIYIITPMATEPQDAQKILLLWIGRLGDFLLSTTFLSAIQSAHPKSDFTLLTGTKGAEAAKRIPGFSKLKILYPAHLGFMNLPLLWDLRHQQFDWGIDLNPSYSRAADITLKIAAPHKIFRTRDLPFNPDKDHMLKRYHLLANRVGIPFTSQPVFRIEEHDREAAATILKEAGIGADKPLILLHAGNFKKRDNRWPEDKFVDLARQIVALDQFTLALSTGPGENAVVADMVRQIGPGAVQLPVLPLGTLGAVLQRTMLFIGNSTGPLHLAVAMKTPTFSLLSQHGYYCWRPMVGIHAWVVSKNWVSCQGIPVSEAWQKLTELLGIISKENGPSDGNGRSDGTSP